ncbi:MAG: hypothetical protein JW395_2993 [Nitrospira sp.]|nr:hypothetical protein [Nitrospira sp.]
MRQAVQELMYWKGKSTLVLALILVELTLIPSHPVNSYQAWKVWQANSATTFLQQASMRRRKRYSMKTGPGARSQWETGSRLLALEVLRESLTAPP